MKISNKLMIIVLLTVFEISLTLWSIFEIAKGATFHQLNTLHLKYSAEFSEEVFRLESGADVNIPKLKASVNNIRQQPIECLAQVNQLNRIVMQYIGTAHAIDLCVKDVADADNVLMTLDRFSRGEIHRETLIETLSMGAYVFTENSSMFEKPITKTVSFIMHTMIPLVIIISFFNILFIAYMSRNITGSINGVIDLLSRKGSKENLEAEIDKNVSGELKTLLDVAKRRLTREVLITEVNHKLEALVERRTASLSRANDELAQFAYRASHDLKAPLTSSKHLAKFIKSDIEAGKLDNAISDADKIVNQMAKLEKLVIGILALTEADTDENNKVEVDFALVLQDIESTVAPLLLESNCEFESDIQVITPMKAQKVRVVQILENLITNAVKYHNPNASRPFVKTSVVEQAHSYTVTVEDNGLGIPEDRHDEIFLMFKRFHPNVSFGSGLGMAIIKKHVDYMQSSITFTTSNKGTTFTVVFPREIRI